MGSASLQGGEFNASGFAAQLRAQEAGQICRGSLKLLMAEGIHVIRAAGQLADIASVCQLDTFRDGNDNGVLFL